MFLSNFPLTFIYCFGSSRRIESKKAPSKSSSKDAAKAVETRGQSNVASSKETQSNQWKESDVAKMRPAQYEKNEEAIAEAIRTGNFIYDISGAAR